MNVIFGLSGCELTLEEQEFFKKVQPVGFILFARNIRNPEQVKNLTSSLKNLINSPNVLILIDQEGGRVKRLKAPYFKGGPDAAGEYFLLAKQKGLKEAANKVYHDYNNVGKELAELGINVNCAPVIDLLHEGAHQIIGDRSFGDIPEIVNELGFAAMKGLMAAGVLPVIKHIPGHGRANKDSHCDLPVIDASIGELEGSDFIPFKYLNFSPFAMTAHVVIEAIDANQPVTLSSNAINYIRNVLGFKNIIITDAIEMKALGGDLATRTIEAQKAGCDIILHCSGKMQEMEEIAGHVKPLNDNVKEIIDQIGNKTLFDNRVFGAKEIA